MPPPVHIINAAILLIYYKFAFTVGGSGSIDRAPPSPVCKLVLYECKHVYNYYNFIVKIYPFNKHRERHLPKRTNIIMLTEAHEHNNAHIMHKRIYNKLTVKYF